MLKMTSTAINLDLDKTTRREQFPVIEKGIIKKAVEGLKVKNKASLKQLFKTGTEEQKRAWKLLLKHYNGSSSKVFK